MNLEIAKHFCIPHAVNENPAVILRCTTSEDLHMQPPLLLFRSSRRSGLFIDMYIIQWLDNTPAFVRPSSCFLLDQGYLALSQLCVNSLRMCGLSPPPPSHYHGNSLLHNSNRKVSPVRLRGNHASLLFSFQRYIPLSAISLSLFLSLHTCVPQNCVRNAGVVSVRLVQFQCMTRVTAAVVQS